MARRLRLLLTTVIATAGFGGAAPLAVAAPAAHSGLSQTGTCAAGQWLVVPSEGMPEVRYETAHFAFRWKGDDVNLADARSAGEKLEYIWQQYMGPIGFAEPYCGSSLKYKANIHLDPRFGLAGGPDDQGHMGMWINPGTLRDGWGLAHEFAHALQGSTGAMRDSPYVGWIWESHANWMTHQLPEFRREVHCSEMLVNYPHLYYGSTRDRYCNWQFFEFLKNRYGYGVINRIWSNAPKRGAPGHQTADPFVVLMQNEGWDLARLNDLFGEWAMRNVTWDYTNPDGSDQGAVYRAAYGGYAPQDGVRRLRTTRLDPIDDARGRFAVPAMWAPQRWGYNLVRLYPEKGAASISVHFRGVVQQAPAAAALPGLADEPASIPAPDSGWRWGVVAVDVHGKPRYSALQRSPDGAVTVPVLPGDQSLWLVIVGAPEKMHKIGWDQPYYSIYRYPWMVDLDGARPEGHQPGAPLPGGHHHPNGGGWVADGASVAKTAYVGPCARVLSGTVEGDARVEDHASVEGGHISGHAVVGGLTTITADTSIRDHARTSTVFMPLGAFEKGIVLSGTAQLIGDVEQRGVSADRGVYYGIVETASPGDPSRGAGLTVPVPEVTAQPDYSW